MTKVCAKCGEVKALDLFNKNKSTKSGLQSYCKNCMTNYNKNNAKRIADCGEQWRKNNAQQVAIYKNIWRNDNPEKMKAAQKKYRQTSGVKRHFYIKAWRANNSIKLAHYERNRCELLVDSIIKKRLGIKNPPKELIELKRVQLQITRELRNKPCQL